MPRLSLLMLAILAAGACTSTEPPPAAPASAPSAPPVLEVEPAPPPPAELPVSTLPWVWYHSLPAALADGFTQVGIGPVAFARRVGDPRRYTARRDDQGIELARERIPEPGGAGEPSLVWRQRITTTTAIGDPIVQVTIGASLEVVVALRVDHGYELHALDDAGVERFSIVALDPPGFSADETRLQLGGTADRLVVYVRGPQRAYLDEVDLERGQRAARATFDDTVLFDRVGWPPRGPRSRRFGHRFATEQGSYRVARRGKTLELRAEDPKGKERWRTTLDPTGGQWWNAAAIVEHDDCVVIVAHSGGSSGAIAYAVDRRDGTLRFTSSPGSIGSIGHSGYANEVAIELDAEGRLQTHGHESGGDYVGVLELPSGRLLGHEVWRD